MLCCAGLFAGVIAGAYLGVPWAPYLTIPLGAAGGLFADITLFRAFERRSKSKEQPVTDQPCCAILNIRKKKQEQIAVATENYVQA